MKSVEYMGAMDCHVSDLAKFSRRENIDVAVKLFPPCEEHHVAVRYEAKVSASNTFTLSHEANRAEPSKDSKGFRMDAITGRQRRCNQIGSPHVR